MFSILYINRVGISFTFGGFALKYLRIAASDDCGGVCLVAVWGVG